MQLTPKQMKINWPFRKEHSDYMRKRKHQNIMRSKTNINENWFAEKLDAVNIKYTRQATWGYRIFDFWLHRFGLAIEIDGFEHDKEYDNYRDEYNYRRSGIIVLRVRNKNEKDAEIAINKILTSIKWDERRKLLGLNSTKKARRHLVSI